MHTICVKMYSIIILNFHAIETNVTNKSNWTTHTITVKYCIINLLKSCRHLDDTILHCCYAELTAYT